MSKQKELKCGIGPLFTDPDPDAARAFFKNKTRQGTPHNECHQSVPALLAQRLLSRKA